MQILSKKWNVRFGQYTLNAVPKSKKVEEAVLTSAELFSIPLQPEKEMRLFSPCALLDPALQPECHHFLENGISWMGVGTKSVSNAPNSSLVDVEFRRRALEQFGESWDKTKKSALMKLKKNVRQEMAIGTPFRLAELGALFICIEDGRCVSIGNAGTKVAIDLVGRCSELSSLAFSGNDEVFSSSLLSWLQKQNDDKLPWPNGSASLRRDRDGLKDTCSVKNLNWFDSVEAENLIDQGWTPEKITVSWENECSGVVSLCGLASVSWESPILATDPFESIEQRFGRLLKMEGEVRTRVTELNVDSLVGLQETVWKV